jgi:hypothetical protein
MSSPFNQARHGLVLAFSSWHHVNGRARNQEGMKEVEASSGQQLAGMMKYAGYPP